MSKCQECKASIDWLDYEYKETVWGKFSLDGDKEPDYGDGKRDYISNLTFTCPECRLEVASDERAAIALLSNKEGKHE